MLRAAAAFIVVLFHSGEIFANRLGHDPASGAFASGLRGVDLFFVLSGFIIAYVHRADIGHPKRLANYAFNRVARLYPSVWIMSLLALTLYSVGFGGAEKAGKLSTESVVASFLLLPQNEAPLVNVTWTLTYEILFYVIFSLLLIRRRLGTSLISLWMISTVIWALLAASERAPSAPFLFNPLTLEFGLGMLGAWHFGSYRKPALWLTSAGAAIGVALFVGGMILRQDSLWAAMSCALGSLLMIVSFARLERDFGLRCAATFVSLGSSSYAIYLVHFSALSLIAAFAARFGYGPSPPLLIFAVLSSLLAGISFNTLIDAPIQRVLRRSVKPLLVPRPKRPQLAS